MNTDLLNVTEIQRFCMHDGPGVRTTVFLKGCPLKCEWCHNPETQKSKTELLFYTKKCIGCTACEQACAVGAHKFDAKHEIDRQKCVVCGSCANMCPTGALELCGKKFTIDDILSTVKKDSAFYGNNGGITISGGEPFAQGKSVINLLRACKENGISTAVETCGYADEKILTDAVPFVDIFLWDIKDTDSERHKRYTGVSNSKILSNLNLVNAMNARIRLRCILVNGVNSTISHYSNVGDIAKTINNFDGVEILPYHAYAGAKSTFLGFEDNGNREWIPTDEQIAQMKSVLINKNVNVL